jgi:protein-disulfide isomerase
MGFKETDMQNKKLVLVSVVVLVALFIGGSYFYKNSKPKNTVDSSLLQRPNSVVLGNKDAKLQLVEFFDPACGTCALYYYHVEKILEEHRGKIKLVLRYAPFHKNSTYAVKMLEAAREQGFFNEVLKFMFDTQSYWVLNHEVQPQVLWKMLHSIKGLDMEKMAEFMNKPDGEKIIKQDLEDGEKLKVEQTPSYFVNGIPLEDFGLKPLKELINSQL